MKLNHCLLPINKFHLPIILSVLPSESQSLGLIPLSNYIPSCPPNLLHQPQDHTLSSTYEHSINKRNLHPSPGNVREIYICMCDVEKWDVDVHQHLQVRVYIPHLGMADSNDFQTFSFYKSLFLEQEMTYKEETKQEKAKWRRWRSWWRFRRKWRNETDDVSGDNVSDDNLKGLYDVIYERNSIWECTKRKRRKN